MHPNARQRLQILEILYHALAESPRKPWVNERELKKLGDVEFALVALEKLKHAERDGFNWQITAEGMLEYESTSRGDDKQRALF